MTGTSVAVMADALWRASTYVAACQLHLRDNVLLSRPLRPGDVKAAPSGHWGTVPGTAWALTHIALASGSAGAGVDLVPLLGAGHAGVVQIAHAWLSGALQGVRPGFSQDAEGLARLCRSFPEVDGLGSEVMPCLPAGDFLGGRIGGCLAFAQGAALGSPGKVMVPIIGDGECETPTTAAAWLAGAALTDAPVVPLVHVNGFRMGGQSLLGRMADPELAAYARGLGWRPHIAAVPAAGHAEFHQVLLAAIRDTLAGSPSVVFLRCVKGWGGPPVVDGQRILGTHRAHKTPLPRAGHNAGQRALLGEWLGSYRPGELFTPAGCVKGPLAAAVAAARWPAARRTPHPAPAGLPATPAPLSFTDAVKDAVGRQDAARFRVFSPDELESNRLGSLAERAGTTELLAEEVLFEQLAGWTCGGGRGVLISYEAFAPLVAAGAIAHLKQRRMPGAGPMPSLNLLLTSYGWHNVYSHGDPSLATTLLGLEDPAVRVWTPADPRRLATVLERVFADDGALNLVVAGKHPLPPVPAHTTAEEFARGAAIWPHLSDQQDPDLTIVVAGDLPASVAAAAVASVRERHGCRVRVVSVLELTTLGDPAVWPGGLAENELAHLLGPSAAVLVLTLGNPAAIWALMKCRHHGPVEVIGWRETSGGLTQEQLAEAAGLTVPGVVAAADRLLKGVA